MSEATDRPQDRGRAHRRARQTAPAPATSEVLDRYRVALREELAMLVEQLQARRVGLMPDVPGELVVPIAERARLWDLAIKIGRELAAGEDLEPELVEPGSPAPAVPRSAPRLSPAQRRALGG